MATAMAAMFAVAAGANAATLSLETDKATYNVGELITMTATLITVGTEPADTSFGSSVALQVMWDSNVATVANSPGGAGFGFATQLVTAGPGPAVGGGNLTSLGGSIPWTGGNTNCVAAGPGAGNTCTIISQSLIGFAFGPDAMTLEGTLVLTADTLGALAGVITQAAFFGNTAADVTIGANFASATVVPEPTTAAMLGLGLLGLSIAGRRRN